LLLRWWESTSCLSVAKDNKKALCLLPHPQSEVRRAFDRRLRVHVLSWPSSEQRSRRFVKMRAAAKFRISSEPARKQNLGAKSQYLFFLSFCPQHRSHLRTINNNTHHTNMSNPEEIAKAFANHYYNIFDTDRKNLASLYVSPSQHEFRCIVD
jgi:hypothetical protein